jgi:hypothetical protein
MVLASIARSAAAADDDAAIVPFLDEGTFIVARLDVDKVDAKVLAKFMDDVTDKMIKQMNAGPGDGTRQKQDTARAAGFATKWLADMTEAGVHRMYFLVLNAGDLREHEDDPVVVVPLKEGMDEERIQGLLKGNFGRSAEPMKLNDSLVMGKPNSITRLRTHVESKAEPGVAAADVMAALAATGDAKDVPLCIAVLPGESTRTWIEENLPEIPPQIGGGETKLISRGLKWASVVVSQKDKPTAHVKIVGADAAKGNALNKLLHKGLDFVKKMAAAAPGGEEITKELDSIQPKLAAETITVTLDPVDMFMIRGMRRERAVTPARPGQVPAKPDDGGL